MKPAIVICVLLAVAANDASAQQPELINLWNYARNRATAAGAVVRRACYDVKPPECDAWQSYSEHGAIVSVMAMYYSESRISHAVCLYTSETTRDCLRVEAGVFAHQALDLDRRIWLDVSTKHVPSSGQKDAANAMHHSPSSLAARADIGILFGVHE